MALYPSSIPGLHSVGHLGLAAGSSPPLPTPQRGPGDSVFKAADPLVGGKWLARFAFMSLFLALPGCSPKGQSEGQSEEGPPIAAEVADNSAKKLFPRASCGAGIDTEGNVVGVGGCHLRLPQPEIKITDPATGKINKYPHRDVLLEAGRECFIACHEHEKKGITPPHGVADPTDPLGECGDCHSDPPNGLLHHSTAFSDSKDCVGCHTLGDVHVGVREDALYALNGLTASGSCNECHKPHKPLDDGNPGRVSITTCLRCHPDHPNYPPHLPLIDGSRIIGREILSKRVMDSVWVRENPEIDCAVGPPDAPPYLLEHPHGLPEGLESLFGSVPKMIEIPNGVKVPCGSTKAGSLRNLYFIMTRKARLPVIAKGTVIDVSSIWPGDTKSQAFLDWLREAHPGFYQEVQEALSREERTERDSLVLLMTLEMVQKSKEYRNVEPPADEYEGKVGHGARSRFWPFMLKTKLPLLAGPTLIPGLFLLSVFRRFRFDYARRTRQGLPRKLLRELEKRGTETQFLQGFNRLSLLEKVAEIHLWRTERGHLNLSDNERAGRRNILVAILKQNDGERDLARFLNPKIAAAYRATGDVSLVSGLREVSFLALPALFRWVRGKARKAK